MVPILSGIIFIIGVTLTIESISTGLLHFEWCPGVLVVRSGT